VTALTLHADVVHVVGNALAAAVLLPPLVQRFGAGVTLLLLLATGAFGNVLAAMVHDARHVAVGASTAIFGAVGMLATLGLAPRTMPAGATAPKPDTADAMPARKRWLAPVAGVVLLTMLGAARGADLAAHAFGFAVGAAVGFGTARLVRQRPRPSAQWPLGVLAALTVVLSWYFAVG
jgi:membrane associated rhomboid family serine protease